MNKLAATLAVFSAALLTAVLISLIPSNAWFIRAVDLVREPLTYAIAVVLLVALFVRSRWRWAAVAMLFVAICINVMRIWPYSGFAEPQLRLDTDTQATGEGRCFTALSANVKMANRQYDEMLDQLNSYDPDLLFLMETDERWIEALEPVLAEYDHVHRHPQPEAFGMVFATRLPVLKSNIVENTYRDTPTLYATVQPEGSTPIEFIGLHPKPPLPDWNTEERDQNIVNAGVQTPDRLPHAFVMGDFNDVPWSPTTTKFREMGDWRDPRIGRGTYPTFPADMLAFGWPLDQLMLKGDLQLRSFEILPENGSDHRAVFASFCPPPSF